MREIKFRVWDTKANSFLENTDEFAYLKLNDIFKEEDLVFQQYTGLKDKNGKEIYEGDILKSNRNRAKSEDEIHTVVWHDKTAQFDTESIIDYYAPKRLDMNPLFLLFQTHFFVEVIGNIFENPELLK